MENATILVVDDDPFIRDIIRTTLEKEGYTIKEANNGQEALLEVSKHIPYLIVSDYMMPKLDGLNFCLKLKEDIQFKHIPIIMLTAKDSMEDKIKLLDIGIDDYIIKPFEPRELAARVKVVLGRTTRSLDANSLTKLPGDTSISKDIEERIEKKAPFAICYIDLSAFKSFNDKYGFEYGNRVIREVAQIIKKLVEHVGNDDDFIGHIGGDDFIVTTTPDIVDQFCTELINRFDLFIFGLYSTEDQKKGYILAHNRDGDLTRFPIMTIRISVVTNEKEQLLSLTQITNIMAELKEKVKSAAKSNYAKN